MGLNVGLSCPWERVMYRVIEYHPAVINIRIRPRIKEYEIAEDDVIAIISPIIFIDGGAPKLKALSIKRGIMREGREISKPLLRNKLRELV